MNNNLEFKIDTTEQYYLIGRYVVDFEHIVFQIRFTLSILFQMQGLKTFEMANIVFGQKQFTAEPLISCFESISNELLKSIDEEEAKNKIGLTPKELSNLISQFRNKFSKQITVRNDILHGTHFISDTFIVDNKDKIDYDNLYIFKDSPNKYGARRITVAEKKQDIILHLKDLNKLYDEFNQLKVKLFNLVSSH